MTFDVCGYAKDVIVVGLANDGGGLDLDCLETGTTLGRCYNELFAIGLEAIANSVGEYGNIVNYGTSTYSLGLRPVLVTSGIRTRVYEQTNFSISDSTIYVKARRLSIVWELEFQPRSTSVIDVVSHGKGVTLYSKGEMCKEGDKV